MTTFFIILGIIYYLFCVVTLVTYVKSHFEYFTFGGVVFTIILALVVSPIYVPILGAVKLGRKLAQMEE